MDTLFIPGRRLISNGELGWNRFMDFEQVLTVCWIRLRTTGTNGLIDRVFPTLPHTAMIPPASKSHYYFFFPL